MASAQANALVETTQSKVEPKKGVTVNGEAGAAQDFYSGFASLDVLRQIGLMVGLAASVAIGFAVVLWSQGEDYQPVYSNMQGYDVSSIMEALDGGQIEYKIDPSNGVILVPSDELSTIRLTLAAAGISRYDGTGYELLDEEQGLGTSQFMEANRLKRSQEGELQRTIASFKNVQSARVQIAIPERTVFVRSHNKPTASVFLTLNNSSNLSAGQVNAIANLVASSVPELSKDDVTIVDQRGNLLSKKESNSPLEIAAKQFEYVQRLEEAMVQRVNNILLPIVGINGFKAEVTADVDFTQTEQADESYDPQSQLVRSEQTMEEESTGPAFRGGIPGALSNQPPPDPTVPEVAIGQNAQQATALPGNRMQQSTRNYELGRTLSYTNHDPVDVRRLSVAVVVDNRREAGVEESIPWTEQDLQQLTTLVRDAVGYSAARGDSVNVINNRFNRIAEIPLIQIPLWQQPWLFGLLKQFLGGFFVLLLVLGVLRPVLKSLAKGNGESQQLALPAAEGGYKDLQIQASKADDDTEVNLAAPREALLTNSQQSYEQQLETVKGLVDQNASRVAQVVKQWINEEEGSK